MTCPPHCVLVWGLWNGLSRPAASASPGNLLDRQISQGSAPCQAVCWLLWVRQQEDTALPELTVCWRDQSLHMTLLMWWDYHKGSSHMQLLTAPKSPPCSGLSRACVCVCVRAQLCLFATPQTAACQALLSMGFSRQEYWSGLPFPSPGEFPDPGIEPASPALLYHLSHQNKAPFNH